MRKTLPILTAVVAVSLLLSGGAYLILNQKPDPPDAFSSSGPADLSSLLSGVNSDAGEIGRQLAGIEQNQAVYAYVNGEPIYEKDIESALLLNQYTIRGTISAYEANSDIGSEERDQKIKELQKSVKTRDQMIKDQIKYKAQTAEAKRLGLTATYEEAKQQVEKNHEGIFDSSTMPQNESTRQEYFDMISGMGMTYEEYLETYEIPGMQQMLTRTKLREHFTASLDPSKQNDMEYADERYEDYCNQLIQKAEINYVQD